jgi:predicted nuclease with TOPRIM domain
MSRIAFKDKVTKAGLLEMGRRLLDVKEKADELNRILDEFNQDKSNLFDDNEIGLGMRDLNEAIEYVQMKLWKLDMQELKKK